MPNVVKFYDKQTEEMMDYIELDNLLWLEFHGSVPENNNQWFRNWYNTIVFGMACGTTWDRLREIYVDTNQIPIINFLEDRYEVKAWYEPK